jgi:hypothetical protein
MAAACGGANCCLLGNNLPHWRPKHPASEHGDAGIEERAAPNNSHAVSVLDRIVALGGSEDLEEASRGSFNSRMHRKILAVREARNKYTKTQPRYLHLHGADEQVDESNCGSVNIDAEAIPGASARRSHL